MPSPEEGLVGGDAVVPVGRDESAKDGTQFMPKEPSTGPSTDDLDKVPAQADSEAQIAEPETRPLAIVPRSQRRGLLARLAIVPEVERPFEYSNATKWGITATVSIAAAAVPFGSTILFPALKDITSHFDTTATVANLNVALYMVAMSIFPLWWSSFSEEFGRRSIYLISFFLFFIFAIICAVSTNIAMLIVFRILTGGSAASVQAVGAGTIADVWESRERGRAMSLFYLGPLLGPLLAPILGGALSEKLGWRSTMYFLAVFGFVTFLLLVFLLPETLPARKPANRDPSTTGETAPKLSLVQHLNRFFIDPLRVLAFLRFPPVLITVTVAAIAFGALFVANIAIQQRYSTAPYNFKPVIVGVLYLPTGIGSFFASVFGGKWLDHILAREAKKNNRYDEKGHLIYLPEDRMRENMWLAHTLYPLSLLLFGWSIQKGVFWFVPSIGLFLFGLSSMLVFAAATTMLTEFVRKKSSAGVAVNNFVRNILSCIGTVVATPWINAIGVGYVTTTIAVFCLVVGYFAIWMLRRNARRWREEMDEKLKGY